MNRLSRLDVFCHNRPVGTMALYKNRLAAFEYDSDWLAEGFSISPFSLPLEKKVFMPKIDPFEGLFGVFADSLPDGWGRLLVDRLMRRNGLDPYEIGSLERLAIVGSSGGARPKILTKVDGEDWMIKFPSSDDGRDIGKQEYEYALCARECGLEVEEVRLFPSENTKGYFGTRRFDRVGAGENGKIHMTEMQELLH